MTRPRWPPHYCRSGTSRWSCSAPSCRCTKPRSTCPACARWCATCPRRRTAGSAVTGTSPPRCRAATCCWPSATWPGTAWTPRQAWPGCAARWPGWPSPGRPRRRPVGWLNDLVHHVAPEHTASVMAGYFDPASRDLTWAQAGHPPPLLVRGSCARPLGKRAGILLGAGRGGYAAMTVRLKQADIVLLYSDGLVERRNRSLDEGLNMLALGGGPLRPGAAHRVRAGRAQLDRLGRRHLPGRTQGLVTALGKHRACGDGAHRALALSGIERTARPGAARSPDPSARRARPAGPGRRARPAARRTPRAPGRPARPGPPASRPPGSPARRPPWPGCPWGTRRAPGPARR